MGKSCMNLPVGMNGGADISKLPVPIRAEIACRMKDEGRIQLLQTRLQNLTGMKKITKVIPKLFHIRDSRGGYCSIPAPHDKLSICGIYRKIFSSEKN